MKKLNVLNVYRTYYPDPPGGLQEAIRQICIATSNLGVKNTIFTLSPNPHPKNVHFSEVDVTRERSLIAPASCDLGGLASFKTFSMLSQKSDLVHYFHPWPFADILNLTTRKSHPKVLTYISDVVRQRILNIAYTPLMRRHLQDMDLIVANCPSYAETSPVLSHASVRNKVRIVPLGIDESSYPKNGDESIFTRANFDSNEPYFLFLGVHRYYKGIHTLIEAARFTKAHIVIAGSGPKTQELMNQVASYGLKNIIFTGQVTNREKVSLFQKCRSFVLPSHLRSEAYGMVLVEASMFAKPMISCEIGTGTSFINKDGLTGYVVPPESSDKFAQAINALLEDESLAAGMGAAARSRYEQMFSGDALGEAYSNLYREIT
jgi:glycosyltransferase involved in cell wall biosynthesis